MTAAPTIERPPKLKPRRQMFADRYLLHRNATRAAKEAGYSERTAYSIGPRLLKDVEVAAYVRIVGDAILTAGQMSAAEALNEIAKIARFNMDDVVFTTRDGDPYVDLNKADRDTMAAIGEVSIKDVVEERNDEGEPTRTVREVKIKTNSKLEALKTIANVHGLLKTKVELEVDDSLAGMLGKARRRAAETGDTK